MKHTIIILFSVSLFVQHVPMLVTCIEAHIQAQICNTLITLAKTIHKFKPVVYLATLCTGCIYYTYSIMITRVCMPACSQYTCSYSKTVQVYMTILGYLLLAIVIVLYVGNSQVC